MMIERTEMPLDGSWHDCPTCDYKNGWHVFFKKTEDEKVLQMLLQCPGCHATFNLGLQVSITQ